jgi:acyl-coenzyme A thioesterase PaaI-like protein
LRVGRRLAVGEAELSLDGGDLVAHAMATYALPNPPSLSR